MNNILKKIMTSIVILSFVLPYSASYAYVPDIDTVPYEESFFGDEEQRETISNLGIDTPYELLYYLGVVSDEKNSIYPKDSATRAQAAAYFARIVSKGNIGNIELPYSDVNENTKEYDGICTAYAYGVIQDNNKFNPTSQITLSDAAKMALYATDYAKITDENSAMSFANNNDLFKGIDTSKNYLTVGELIKMVENTLCIPCVEITFNTDGCISMIINNDKSILEDRFKIVKQRGIVTAIGYSSLYGDCELEDLEVEINRASFKCVNKVSDDYLGKSVYAYVDIQDESEKTLVSVWENRNNIYKYEYKDMGEVGNNKITCYNGDKTVNIKTKADSKILYNDVYFGTYDKSINDDKYNMCDKIICIDNDTDGYADVIKIYKSETYIVKSISTIGERIDLMYDYDSIYMNSDNYDVYLSKDGNKVEYNSLLQWDVLSSYCGTKSDGRKIYNIIISNEKLTSVLSSEYKDDNELRYYCLENEKFQLSDNFYRFITSTTSETKPTIGKEFTFLLTYDEKLAGITTANRGFSFGWLMRAFNDEDNTDIFCVKLFTTDGSFEQYVFKNKVKFFSDDYLRGTKLDAADVYKKIRNDNGTLYDLIGYRLNSNNEICELALPIDRTAYLPGTIDYPLTKDYTNLKGYDSEGNPKYNSVRSYTNVLDSRFNSGGTTTLVYPVDLDARSNEKTYKKENFSYNDKYFDTTHITIYNTDKFFRPSIITMGMNVTQEINNENTSYMIESITDSINEDDQPVRSVSFYSGNTLLTKNLSEDCVISQDKYKWIGMPDDVSLLKKGDIFQYSTNNLGEINCVRVIYKSDNPSPMGYQDPRIVDSTGITMFSVSSIKVIHGKVIDYNDRTVLVNIAAEGENDNIWPIITGNGGYGAVTFMLYDKQKNKVQIISRNELKADDEIVIRKRYNYGVDFYVIR